MQYEIGIVSGYFNPVHFGHIQYINEAKLRCKELIVIVNNDRQVTLKGSKPFMDELHRANIMHSIKGVDFVLISSDFNKEQCETLTYIRTLWPHATIAFFNSGDRTLETTSESEKITCEENKINFVLLNQPKIYSSSELLKQL